MAEDKGAVVVAAGLKLGGTTVKPTGTEINYLDNVTSPIQTQLDAKQATIADGDLTIAKTSGLQTALDAKQASLTAGSGITISGSTISAGVTSGSISDGAITTAKIADDAVTAAKIVDGAITAAKLASGVGGEFSHLFFADYHCKNAIALAFVDTRIQPKNLLIQRL